MYESAGRGLRIMQSAARRSHQEVSYDRDTVDKQKRNDYTCIQEKSALLYESAGRGLRIMQSAARRSHQEVSYDRDIQKVKSAGAAYI